MGILISARNAPSGKDPHSQLETVAVGCVLFCDVSCGASARTTRRFTAFYGYIRRWIKARYVADL